MKIIIGADHGGFKLKEQIKKWLQTLDYKVVDVGAKQLDPQDDYPQFAFAAAKKVVKNKEVFGVLFCRSGAGMTIAANKVAGIRAVELFNANSAQHARQHNNANIAALSADWLEVDEIKEIIKTFLETEFANEARHLRRINQIKAFEAQN